MKKNTINKYLLISLIILVQLNLIGCKAGTVKLPEMFQKYSVTQNQDVFEKAIGKRIKSINDKNIGQRQFRRTVDGKSFYINAYIFRNDLSKGYFITLELIEQTKKGETLILQDVAVLSQTNEIFAQLEPLSYGEKNENGHYPIDETKFGIYEYGRRTGLPFYKKVIPREMISVENDKLKVEVPKNDDYFIYLYDEI